MKRLLAILFTIHYSLFTVYAQYTTTDDIKAAAAIMTAAVFFSILSPPFRRFGALHVLPDKRQHLAHKLGRNVMSGVIEIVKADFCIAALF